MYTDVCGVYTAFQLQLITNRELFYTINMERYVIAAVGPLVGEYKPVGDEVFHLPFAFGQLHCMARKSSMQPVVAAGMRNCLLLMYFRDRKNAVNFLGKDYESMTSFASDFLVWNENHGIIASDWQCKMQRLNYEHASLPELPDEK